MKLFSLLIFFISTLSYAQTTDISGTSYGANPKLPSDELKVHYPAPTGSGTLQFDGEAFTDFKEAPCRKAVGYNDETAICFEGSKVDLNSKTVVKMFSFLECWEVFGNLSEYSKKYKLTYPHCPEKSNSLILTFALGPNKKETLVKMRCGVFPEKIDGQENPLPRQSCF